MWTRDRIRLCSSRWAWRTAAWVVSSSGPQKSHRAQEATYTSSSIKPGYAHPPTDPTIPTVPSSPQGVRSDLRPKAVRVRTHMPTRSVRVHRRTGSDGRPKQQEQPEQQDLIGPHGHSTTTPDGGPDPHQNQTPVHIHPFGYPNRARSKNRRIPPFLSMTLIKALYGPQGASTPRSASGGPPCHLRPARGQLDPQIRAMRMTRLRRSPAGRCRRPNTPS